MESHKASFWDQYYFIVYKRPTNSMNVNATAKIFADDTKLHSKISKDCENLQCDVNKLEIW